MCSPDAYNEAIVINGLSVDGTRAVYSIRFEAAENFVVELTTGTTMRMLNVEEDVTDRFGLNGSADAIFRAYGNCKRQLENTPQPHHPAPDFRPKVNIPTPLEVKSI